MHERSQHEELLIHLLLSSNQRVLYP